MTPKHPKSHVPPAEPPSMAEPPGRPAAEPSEPPAAEPSLLPMEPPPEAVARLEGELDALKDRELRLRAEYDNYRKRVARERAELGTRALAEVVTRLVDVLDDLARFAHIDPAATDAKTLHEAIELVERKVWKQLGGVGLVRLDQTGVPFDPKRHEAVTTAPAASAEQDHTVGAVLQPGYMLGETLIRAARVTVLVWQGGDGEAAPQ